MTTKEIIKKEIDKIPDDLLEDVLKFLNTLKNKKSGERKLHTYKLKGNFDNLNIRDEAYD